MDCRLRRVPDLIAGVLLVLAGCQRAPEPLPASPQVDAYRQPERLVAALGLRPGDQVADVGAGGGYLSLRLARAVGPAGRVVATDIDPAALALLRRRGAGMPQLEARQVTAMDPGLEPGRYDLILLAQVDHLLPDRAAYLRALLPALKPGGRIAVANSERHLDAMRAAAARVTPLPVREARIGLPGQFLLFLSVSAKEPK